MEEGREGGKVGGRALQRHTKAIFSEDDASVGRGPKVPHTKPTIGAKSGAEGCSQHQW
jgi:hypothetical protein